MAPSVTAGVSDDVAQDADWPANVGRCGRNPMPARPATIKDPGISDQIVRDKHSLTHFPSQSWCKDVPPISRT